MGGDGPVEMTAAEIDALLGRGGTAVLALARDDEPYATPVSYGYDDEAREFLLRLGVGEDREKADFLEGPASARLVAYGPVEDGWASVIARGTLEPVEADELTVETARVLREGDSPLFDILGDDLPEVEFRVYRLAVDVLTGRSTT